MIIPPKLPKQSSTELRQRAEKKLEKQAQHKKTVFNEGNAKRVLHELQVHQIELEMQNHELQQARIAEIKSANRYTDLFEFAPIAYFVIEPSSIISQLNLRGASLLGSERANIVGQRFLNYVAAGYKEVFKRFLVAIFKGEGTQSCEVVVQIDKRELLLSIDANIDEVGTECLTSMIDITERKHSREVLEESENRFRQLFEKTADALLLLDPVENKFIDCNAAAMDMLGYKDLKELPSLHPAELSPPLQPDGRDSFEKSQEMISQALQKGSHRFEWIHRSLHREDFPVEVLLTPVQIENQTLILTTWRDITDHKRAIKQLIDMEERFHSLAENMPGTTYRCKPDEQRTMLFISHGIETMSGFPATDFMGENPVRTFAELVHPDDIQPLTGTTNKAISEKTTYSNDIRIIDKQGLTHFVLSKGKAIYAIDGSPKYLDGIILDVTERKQLELREKSRADIMEAIATKAALPEILKNICISVEQLNLGMLCSILLLDDEGKHLLLGAAPSLPDFYSTAIHGLAVGMAVGSCGTAAYTGKRVIVSDIQSHPYWEQHKELAQKADLAACWSEPIFSSQGKILGAFGIYHHVPTQPTNADITLIEQSAQLTSIAIEKHQTNLALKLSEERWAFAIEGSGDGVWDWDLQTDQVIYSARWKEILGYAEDEIMPSHQEWIDRIHPEDSKVVSGALQACLEGHVPTYVATFRTRCKDDSYKWILGRGMVASRDAQNKALRMVGTHTDISELKLAEEKLQLAASVFSHASEGITITDSKGAILDVNDTFIKITGYSREEVLGKNPRILQSGRQSPEFYTKMWATLLREGTWNGDVWNRHKDGEVYAEHLTISAVHNANTQEINYVALFTDITAQINHRTELKRMAHYDVLTNLPNRVLLTDRLVQAMAHASRDNRSIAVLFVDLDGFKVINDLHGHHVGDELLIAVSNQLAKCLRGGDTLARIGGDEFVVVLAGIEKIKDCEPILKRLLDAASASFSINSTELQISASIGVTLYPQDDAEADVLIRHADQAMYIAKQEGKNRYRLFDTVQDIAVKTQSEGVQGIRSALDKNQFVLYYQPKVNMKTGAVIGAEALIRWQDPDRGLVAPNDFLPIIENHRISIEIGEWVINSALDQIAVWNRLGLDLPISVNISAYQLQDEDFSARLAALLAAHPEVDPSDLEIEVLETSQLGDVNRVSEIMHACIALGVHFALDDFGTGYSSLTYLRRLPAQAIKIDQSFIRDMLIDPDDLAIVDGIIGLAKSFKREVIAEGVETIEHGSALLQLGCHLAQGYGIARPMPASDVPSWISEWKPDSEWTS